MRPFLAAIVAVFGAASCGGAQVGEVPQLVGFPSPRSVEKEASRSVSVESVCFHGMPRTASARAVELAEDRGLSVGTGACGWDVTFTSEEPDLGVADGDEAYSVVTALDDGRASTTVFSRSDRGALYAWMAALNQSERDAEGVKVFAGTVLDHPSFSRRGIVEGTYGIPFSAGERSTLIRVAATLRENTYIYSPKQDPYCRELWASDYPSTSLLGPSRETITAMVKDAEHHLVDLVWGVSPGLNYDFSHSDDEFPRLVRKIEHLRALGVKRFALFLDDIPGHDAPAHARLINALLEHLRKDDEHAHLIAVGATYAGDPDGYTRTLGSLVDEDVEILWTGKAVVSEAIARTDLAQVNDALKRHVGIWDNWPRERFAFRRRGADLAEVTRGFYSNPVITEFNLNPPDEFIAVLGPIADYLWAAERYSSTESYPEESFQRWLGIAGAN